MDRNTTAIRIDDPVFPHTTTVEQLSLDSLVATASAFRHDLHDKSRCPLDVLLCHDLELVTGDEHEVGLDDVVKGEDHVDRRQEDSPEARTAGQEVRQREVQPAYQILVTHVGCRRHVVDSVDDLVPKPVVLGEQQEIVVGEPSSGISSRCHRIAPVHASIVASSPDDDASGMPVEFARDSKLWRPIERRKSDAGDR